MNHSWLKAECEFVYYLKKFYSNRTHYFAQTDTTNATNHSQCSFHVGQSQSNYELNAIRNILPLSTTYTSGTHSPVMMHFPNSPPG